MSGWTAPTRAAAPPGAGTATRQGPDHEPGEDRPGDPDAQTRRAEADALADRARSTEELRRDARHTRARINAEVSELRHRFGLDDESRARRKAARGPFAPAKRHPFTVTVAGLGAAFMALATWRAVRNHGGGTGPARRRGSRGRLGRLTRR